MFYPLSNGIDVEPKSHPSKKMSPCYRLFGTYVKEKPDEEIAYGLVTPVASFDQLWCQFFEFKALGIDKGQMRNDKGEEIFPGFVEKVSG